MIQNTTDSHGQYNGFGVYCGMSTASDIYFVSVNIHNCNPIRKLG